MGAGSDPPGLRPRLDPRKDLALYTGLFAGDPVPAPGRQLRDWESEAVEQMAAHLVELGLAVLDERPAVDDAPNDWGDPLLGALRVRRYGWETKGVVRVDAAGEVFIRLDPDAVAGPLFRPVPDEERRAAFPLQPGSRPLPPAGGC